MLTYNNNKNNHQYLLDTYYVSALLQMLKYIWIQAHTNQMK